MKELFFASAIIGIFLLASPDTITSLVNVSRSIVQISGLILLLIGASRFLK